jgi:glycosyltransferase involved in cell wall biosynthesis
VDDNRPKILILTDLYLPGFKSGALRTLVNMVERMSDEFNFYIVTRNHDSDGDRSRYERVKMLEWQQVGRAQVFYAAPDWFNLKNIRRVLQDVAPDAVYLNSFFSSITVKFLTLRRLSKLEDLPVVLAPEGEFTPGAFEFRARKKKTYLALTTPLGFFKNLIWKAASKEEEADVYRMFGREQKVFVAANMQPRTILENYTAEIKPAKQPGAARLVFLSRLNEKKNLRFALELVKSAGGEIIFDIFGSIEKAAVWSECENLIRQMPPNAKVEYRGAIEHEAVARTLAGYHFFFLPTFGENFGHVVIESLAAGTPVLLSDQTPWRALETASIGWDIALDDREKWENVLQECLALNDGEYQAMAARARDYAVRWLAMPEIENANRAVLRHAVSPNKIKS